jgi:hypothetical protein
MQRSGFYTVFHGKCEKQEGEKQLDKNVLSGWTVQK